MPPDLTDTLALPALSEIFAALRKGRHLCPDDGILYQHLRAHEALYQALFARLGFQLVSHARGFFHFKGEDNLSDTAAKQAVFMFILIEWLADQGKPVEESLLTSEFAVDQLPHFATERYQACMREAGVANADELDSVLNALERYGFAARPSPACLRFRAPVYRFLDLCQEVLAHSVSTATSSAEATP